MAQRVIVVEDEPDLAELIVLHLRRENLEVTVHDDGVAGLRAIEREVPDLVVLDLMLPGLNGHDICRRIRTLPKLAEVSVLMLTARSEETDIVTGLELGADDYVTKPFSPRELVARVRGLLRRRARASESSEIQRGGSIEIDRGRHEVRVENELVTLTRTEFSILSYLISDPGRVRSRADILVELDDAAVLERTVDVHMASLRKKLGDAAKHIGTVRGVGYRFEERD